MKVLWMNWRDIRNPEAGGAEVFTHEIAKRLVQKGHEITLFTAAFSGCNDIETIDGVSIHRKGGRYSVYSRAKSYYNSNKYGYDLVVDEINTRPFLTPKYVRDRPILALIHQLAREFWFYETQFPLNYLGYYYLEKRWLSLYRNVTTVTVSLSSKRDLDGLGFRDVNIIPEGLDIVPLSQPPQKEEDPTIVFLGRLKKAKLPDHALNAFSIIKREIPNAKMWVIGDGYMMQNLRNLNSEGVNFLGKVSNETRNRLLGRSHLVLVPAIREGWGLVVIESNALGTPAIGYDVPGLRDSIIDGKTGILTKTNTPEELAENAIRALKDGKLLRSLTNNALQFARGFKWETSAEEFNKTMVMAVERFQQQPCCKN